ncbi:glycosyltransferase family 2 protein [Fervidibacillus halotolerans]|uniref:Glycosyltransferase family 2 protein n=1 Tax=Fervidibacillus halotolerans TaxID=2980027 RepID=A0A9E8M0S9_9BACI|nr:glycosyltransferase family 2 protein [Fervidibacillus halotolerans]WAA13330.1 glycosyltransferase family 2 protein [Fervidibacillus halotolerans]
MLEGIRLFLIGVQFLLLFFWLYWLFISLFGFGRAKRLPSYPAEKRFLILVPAHNEEKVIGNLVENLMNLDYPKDLYDVVVIADNCTDKTAEISQSLGAKVIVHESLPGELRGKPYGIKYALDIIGDDLTKKYDAVAIFDADNLVSLNYLKEMNNHLIQGDQLIQCYLDTKNPQDNWVTLSYATTYYYMNRSWQLAKSRLGLGNAIGGTGFCVDSKLLKEIGWTARSLTEDLEFTMQCLLRGVPAKWSHYAVVYDEKPESFWASCIQRLRWARGHWDVCFKYAPKLLWRSIRKRDILAFDGFIYLINPGKIVLNALTGGIILFITFFNFRWFTPIFPRGLWLFMLLFQFLYIAYSIIVDSKQKISKVRAFLSLSIFNFSYIPLFVWALVTKGNKHWKRTDHSKNISIEDLPVAGVESEKE